MGEEGGGEVVEEEEVVVEKGGEVEEGVVVEGGGDRGGGGGSSLKGKQPGPGGSLRAVNWDRIDLKPLEKNFYNATSASRKMDQRLVEQFR